MKNGSIVEQRDVNSQSHYTFGRTDACDFQLEHPSISRLHAVLQLSSTGEAFLYDAASAHGTFLNKQKLKAQVHVPLRYIPDAIQATSTPWHLFHCCIYLNSDMTTYMFVFMFLVRDSAHISGFCMHL